METDDYAGFAERYDLFFPEFGRHDPAVVQFYRKLFHRHRVRSVLDCACGTGRELPLFSSLGLEVVGSDVSESMLARARRNLAAAGISVPLHQLDYRDLPAHFDRTFDAVTCLSTSIAHMPDEDNALRAFKSMRGVLRQGGLLILTQGTSDRQWREKPRFILALGDHDFSRLFVIDYLGDRFARYNVLDLVHTADRQELEVWSTEYKCLLLRDDQERLLRAAGFAGVDFYGAYDFTPYDEETSPRIIAVARNQQPPAGPATQHTKRAEHAAIGDRTPGLEGTPPSCQLPVAGCRSQSPILHALRAPGGRVWPPRCS